MIDPCASVTIVKPPSIKTVEYTPGDDDSYIEPAIDFKGKWKQAGDKTCPSSILISSGNTDLGVTIVEQAKQKMKLSKKTGLSLLDSATDEFKDYPITVDYKVWIPTSIHEGFKDSSDSSCKTRELVNKNPELCYS